MEIAKGLHKGNDGRIFEAVEFTNGIIEYEFSDTLHRLNFIANEYGLNLSIYVDYTKAKDIHKATKK